METVMERNRMNALVRHQEGESSKFTGINLPPTHPSAPLPRKQDEAPLR
jgi:hypothetical protein